VRNAEAFETYPTLAAASISQYGDRYLVRAGPIETLEGGWTPRAIIVIEFADLEHARAWYRSPEYALALAVRQLAPSAAISFSSMESTLFDSHRWAAFVQFQPLAVEDSGGVPDP
jgi:uncharacterized protein (DUF1330 family)